MSVIFTEGFDMYNGAGASTGLLARFLATSLPSGAAITFSTGRFSGQCLNFVGTNSPAFPTATANVVFSNSAPTSISVGFAAKISTFTGAAVSRALEILNVGGSAQCGVGFTTTGAISVYRGALSATLGTGAIGAILPNNWYYIGLEIVLHPSAGSINVYLNGVSYLTVTGVNTLGAGSGGANILSLVNNSGNSSTIITISYDDIYITDSATWLGERRIETLRPSSDSAVTWTPNSGANNFSRVNETTVDGDTSYVSTSTVGNADLYGIGALSSTPTTIDAISVVCFAEKTDATTRTLYNSVKSGSTTSDGSAYALSATYTRNDRIITQDPATSAAWTASGVNNLLIGPKLAS
jgi:hypothetical protein